MLWVSWDVIDVSRWNFFIGLAAQLAPVLKGDVNPIILIEMGLLKILNDTNVNKIKICYKKLRPDDYAFTQIFPGSPI